MTQDAKPVALIAEFCQNHNGDFDMLARMIEAAAQNGATHGKMQTIFADNVAYRPQFEEGFEVDGVTMAIKRPYKAEYNCLKDLEITFEQSAEFVRICRESGLTPMTTCFVHEHAMRLRELGFKTIKLASYDCASFPMLRDLKALFEELIVSTGATFDDEIVHAADILEGSNFALLHCVTIYPTPLVEMHLARMEFLRRHAPRVGFSDHSLVARDGVIVAKAAITLGAELVERHFTTLGADESRDGPVSIGPQYLQELADFSALDPGEREAKMDAVHPGLRIAIGEKNRMLSDAELLNRDYYRWSLRQPATREHRRDPHDLQLGGGSSVVNGSLERLAVIVDVNESIDATVRQMALRFHEVAHAGLAVVLDGEQVVGVITDGDVRRAYAADVEWSAPISAIMTRDPITLPADQATGEMVPEIYRRVHRANHLTADVVRHILITDEEGRLVTIHDFLELLRDQDKRHRNVVVFGMGYVGLTLAISLANYGHIVTGLDVDSKVVARLNAGDSHIHERGLTEMLRVVLRSGHLEVCEKLDQHRRGIYIIAVGTPLGADNKPDYTALEAAARTIGERLKHGDQIMLRSTVPAGTTRGLLVPVFERESGLIAGEDFHVAFSPERTLAGQALVELRKLPQIVGGLTPNCTAKAAAF